MKDLAQKERHSKKAIDCLLKETKQKATTFKRKGDKDAFNGIFRLGNVTGIGLHNISPLGFRMVMMLIENLDKYPMEMLDDPKCKAKSTADILGIPEEYRTVSLSIKEYLAKSGLSESAGRRQFVLDLFDVWNYTLVSHGEITPDGLNNESMWIVGARLLEAAAIKITKSNEMVSFHDLLMKKEFNKKNLANFHINEVKACITESAAKSLLFLMNDFTRVNRDELARLKPKSSKLYIFMAITSGKYFKKSSWDFITNLSGWNNFFNTHYKTLSELKRDLVVVINNINDNTVFYCEQNLCTKVNGRNTELSVYFRYKNGAKRITDVTPKKIATKVKPEKTKAKPKPKAKPKKTKRPAREKLPPYPSKMIHKDNHERLEIAWAINCYRILTQYQDQLAAMNLKLLKRDQERLDRCDAITRTKP